MPLKRCQRNGRPGYKWGDSGKCYTYESSSKPSREQAKRRAKRQGRAIEANK